MKNFEFILSLDPSGAFNEGKGCTGWCVMECKADKITKSGNINAKDYEQMESYWQAHTTLISNFRKKYKKRMIVVIEDYLLYGDKARNQINSRMETSKLIGVLQFFCFSHHIPYYMQTAGQVKNRWKDSILQHKGYLKISKNKLTLPTGDIADRHCKDAVRHAVHYNTFKNKKEDFNDNTYSRQWPEARIQ